MILSKLFHSPLEATITLLSICGGAVGVYFIIRKLSNTPIPIVWDEVGTVTKIFFHPLKSAKPISVDSAFATTEGLSVASLVARSFMVFKEKNLLMVTGRETPKLTTLAPHLEGEFITFTSLTGDQLKLNIKELNNIKHKIKMTIRGDPVEGVDCGSEAAEFMTKHLSVESNKLRLIYGGGDPWTRPARAFDFYTFTNFRKNDSTLYNDATTYMIMTESSMEELNNRLKNPVDFRFYRPTIVIGGTKAFNEDTWGHIKIGDKVILHESKPREVCALTTIDPNDGSKKTEHMDMLKKFRSIVSPAILADKWKGRPLFGVHCGIDVEGDIRIGDKVYVSRREVYYKTNNNDLF